MQVNVAQLPGGDVQAAVERFAAAEAERVVLVLDPPHQAGSIAALARRALD